MDSSLNIIDKDIFEMVKDNMPNEEEVYGLSELFKVFSDNTRIKILSALLENDMCVTDISNLLGMTDSAISHQLRVLRQSNLVSKKKNGKLVYYSIKGNYIKDIFNKGLIYIDQV